MTIIPLRGHKYSWQHLWESLSVGANEKSTIFGKFLGLPVTESAQSIFLQVLGGIPEPLRYSVESHWQRFGAATDYRWSSSDARDCLRALPRVWACSEFVARSCSQYPQLLTELIDSGDLRTSYTPDTLATRISAHIGSIDNESSLKQSLRVLRRRELVRIAWRDLAGWAELAETMADLSLLADACIDSALNWLYPVVEEKYGTPIGAHSGEPTSMVVLGLGKLGGCELNFSSDVDLMFAYSEPGTTIGSRVLSNHESHRPQLSQLAFAEKRPPGDPPTSVG